MQTNVSYSSWLIFALKYRLEQYWLIQICKQVLILIPGHQTHEREEDKEKGDEEGEREERWTMNKLSPMFINIYDVSRSLWISLEKELKKICNMRVYAVQPVT